MHLYKFVRVTGSIPNFLSLLRKKSRADLASFASVWADQVTRSPVPVRPTMPSYVNRGLSTQPLDVLVSVGHSCHPHHLWSPPGIKLKDPSYIGKCLVAGPQVHMSLKTTPYPSWLLAEGLTWPAVCMLSYVGHPLACYSGNYCRLSISKQA